MTNETTHDLRHGFTARQTENGGWIVINLLGAGYQERITKAFSNDTDFVNFIVIELGGTPERSKLVAAALEALEADLIDEPYYTGPVEGPYVGHTTGE